MRTEIVPEDMISYNCGREFNRDRIFDVQKGQEVETLILGILGQNVPIRDRLLLDLAGALGGHNLGQTIGCLLGPGCEIRPFCAAVV